MVKHMAGIVPNSIALMRGFSESFLRRYVSETWVTKQLPPDLQAVSRMAFSGENLLEC